MNRTLYYSITQLFKFSVCGMLPSVLATIVCVKKSLYLVAVIVTVIINLLILAWTLFVLYKFRIKHKGKRKFYICNFSAMAAYCLVGTGVAALIKLLQCSAHSALSVIYTYFFFNFKSAHFFSFSSTYGYRIGRVGSALIYSVFYLLIVLLFPMFVDKYKVLHISKTDKEEDEEDKQ